MKVLEFIKELFYRKPDNYICVRCGLNMGDLDMRNYSKCKSKGHKFMSVYDVNDE